MSMDIEIVDELEGLKTSKIKLKIRPPETKDEAAVESDLVGPCSILAESCEIVGEKNFAQTIPRKLTNLAENKGGLVDETRIHAGQNVPFDIDLPDTQRKIQIYVTGK